MKDLIKTIDNDPTLQDLSDWPEVRKALARVEHLIKKYSILGFDV